jgi:hypothetical protein
VSGRLVVAPLLSKPVEVARVETARRLESISVLVGFRFMR